MTILDKIMASKRREIAQAKAERPEAELRAMIRDLPPPRDFMGALAEPGPIKLIAEVKKASPSKGLIREDFDPIEIAKIYATHGATCISVLTDAPFFQGQLSFLSGIRAAVAIPLLRKDFLLDSYQLLEARLYGADAVLLIAECLDDCFLRKLHVEALEFGLTPLVEFFDPENLPRVLDAGVELIGINNRDLRTFQVDLGHTIRMRAQIPADCLVVGESGIHSRDDALQLERARVNAMLVGEHLMAQADIGSAVDRLLGKRLGGDVVRE